MCCLSCYYFDAEGDGVRAGKAAEDDEAKCRGWRGAPVALLSQDVGSNLTPGIRLREAGRPFDDDVLCGPLR